MTLWNNGMAVKILHCLEPGVHDKLYIGRVDVVESGGQTYYQAICSYGAASRPSLSDHLKGRYEDYQSAACVVQDMINRKIDKGYVDITAPNYRGGLGWSRCIQKVDTSMTVGGSDGNEPRANKPAGGRQKSKHSQPVAPPITHNTSVRSSRTISV